MGEGGRGAHSGPQGTVLLCCCCCRGDTLAPPPLYQQLSAPMALRISINRLIDL